MNSSATFPNPSSHPKISVHTWAADDKLTEYNKSLKICTLKLRASRASIWQNYLELTCAHAKKKKSRFLYTVPIYFLINLNILQKCIFKMYKVQWTPQMYLKIKCYLISTVISRMKSKLHQIKGTCAVWCLEQTYVKFIIQCLLEFMQLSLSIKHH